MGRYGGWGAADGVFAPGASGNDLRDQERLRTVLARLGGSEQAGERLFSAAGLTTLNAHYTDPVLVRAMYRALGDLGLEQGTVVEAGVGAGQFAAFAPDGIRITGIELDPATALIAQLLHPDAEILVGSVSGPRFARVRDQSANPVRVPRDTADGFAGNVPFSDIKWPDEVLNPGTRFPLHDHATLWGVTRVAPGGLCAVITSRYTADKQNPGFRRTLAAEMDLIGMVRLPSTAHKRMAGTQVVTDIIIGRRLGDGERPRTDPETWEQARPLPLPGTDLAPLVNTYFHANPQHVLGTLTAGGMRHADDFSVMPSGDLEEQLGAALGEITARALAAGQRHEPRPAARPVIEILSRRPDGTVSASPDGTFTQVVHGQDTPLKIDSAREADQTRRLVALAEALAALRAAEAACAEDTDETDAVRARLGQVYDAYTGEYGAIGRFTVRTTNYHVKTFKTVLDRLDFSKMDVPDPEVTLLEAYLGRGALTRIVQSVTDPGHVRHGTRKDKQGKEVATQTQLVQVASVRAALTAALAEIPQGADAERLTAAFGERMSRIETGEVRTRLMPVAFRSDPRRPAVESLENFDPVTQAAVKKPVFSRRTAVPHRLELGADTPEEALDLVLIHRRRVDLPEIARLLGTDEADARKKLGTLVFEDPAAGGTLVAAGEYLSGNVREKLAQARTAAAGDPERYTANVEGLQAVQPSALGAEDIQARLGSAWLSRQVVQDGLRQILEDPTLTVTHPGGAAWDVSTRKERNSNAQDRYGTSDWNAVDLAEALLTNASVVVYRKRIDPQTGEEKSYRDDNATLFAYRKAQRLDADFVSWLWSDPDRADECVRLYNGAYNNQVKRKWDSSPFYIPGLAPGIRLHPFQNAMVRRLHTESGLAAWVVGSGKTELGIVAAMEGHRLGRQQLAAIVCPASLVNQWRDRIYRTYPQAQVLVADDDLRARRDAREIFTERAASGDYQLTVVPYEFFGSLPLSADAARASADEEIDKLTRYAREAASQGDRVTAKSLQGQIARIEAQYSAAALGAGGATGFTDARIDAVIVDEWHNFRRITRDSNNRSMAIIKGSGRADHMLAVFDYVRKRHPEGLLLGLSGTPLEQSIADAWAAMRFFAPGRLKELGLEEFDAFLTTFGRTEARREPTPTGSGLHVRERASNWFNLPEMRRALWDPFADVVRSADLGLNVPRLTGGRPQTHVLPQTPGQAGVQAEIDAGYARFKAGDRGADNHILRLMDRAAKNALHPRMLGMETDGQIKLEVWADDAAAWYHATKDARFLDREGSPHPVPGALRMVACEIGVPDPARPNAWSVYAEMRSLLAARGVPADKVRFAQDAAGSDRKKAALWEDARTGRCNFVIGSAQTAGTGVDVPDRLQVLDYMTLSWNPTGFEQWLGRIVRQGNQNPEVTANVWSTEGSIEVLRADKIAMKSAPFEALLDGTSETRRVNEETYDPLSAWAADMATRMSGNPLLNQQREAQLEVETAQGMQDEWQRENGVKARRVATMNTEIQELEEKNAAIGRALGRAVDTRGDKFAAQVGTVLYTARAEAGAALIAALAATAAGDDVSALAGGNPQHLGELAGFPVTARYKRYEPQPPAEAEDGPDDGPDPGPPPGPAERTWIYLGLEGVPNGQVDMMSGGELPDRDPVGLMTSLEGRIRRLPGDRDKNTAAIAENRDQIAKTKTELAKPSPYLQQLADARDALDRIETEIDAQLTPEPDAPAPAEPATASPGDPAPDDSAEPAADAAPADGDGATLPSWTAGSPYSAAITAACQAALADRNVTQMAGYYSLDDRFLEWLSDTGWLSGHVTAAAGGGGAPVSPFARAVLDDPVFAVDLACAIGTVVHETCTGQTLPPRTAARRPIPPLVEMSALRHWQEQDEATGRAAGTDQWYDLVDAARIDIWLSRAGLPRAGRQVLVDSGGHAVLELAAGGEQWRLTVPSPKDTRREATARYSLTRSGRDGWTSMLNGTPGSTTPEQAAVLLVGTLTEEGAIPPPTATPAPDQAAPAAAAQAGQPADLSSFPALPAGDPPEPVAEDREGDQAAAGTADWPPGHPYASQRDALVAAFHSAHDGPPAAMRGAAQARDRQNFQVSFTIWGRRRLQAAALAAISGAASNSVPPPDWARAVDRDPALAAALVDAAAAGAWRDLIASADAAGVPGPAAAQPGETVVSDWTAGHAFAAQIRQLRQEALASPDIAALASSNDPGRFARPFREWLEPRAAEAAVNGADPGYQLAVLDDASFTEDLMATLAQQVYQELCAPDHRAQAAATDVFAAESVRRAASAARSAIMAAGEDGGEFADLRDAVAIDMHLARAGITGFGRAVTWDSGSGCYAIDITGRDGTRLRLRIPPAEGRYTVEPNGGPATDLPARRGEPAAVTARLLLERAGHAALAGRLPVAAADRARHDLATPAMPPAEAAPGTGPSGDAPAAQAGPEATPAPESQQAARGTGDVPPRPAGDGEEPVASQVPPGTGMTEEELDAVHASATRYPLFGIREPSPQQAERALDYASWYMAAYGDEESMEDLPSHPWAWERFAGQGYPARERARAASAERDQNQPAPGAAARTTAAPGHAGPEPPAAPGSAAGLRQLAEAHGLAAETSRTSGTLTVTVHDQGRTVLLHDDVNGTTAGGRRLDPAQAASYLAAYASYPQLPPRCLLDLARHDPAEPAPLTLTSARETAALHGLEVRVRRVGGQSYITFCEPGTSGAYPGDIEIPGEPVLSYPAGSGNARHGPCAVPVAAIGSYLAAYRENVPPAMLTAREPYDWRSRVVPLTPYLIDGGGHFMPAVRDRLRAALTAGRDERAAEARALLAEAEALAPLALTPEREADLTAAVRRDTASHHLAEDPAASLARASERTLNVTARELDWVRAYIAAHPEVRRHAEEDEPAAALDTDREAAANLAAQCKEAFDKGEYERALALIDETELLRPDVGSGYDRARNTVRAAMRRSGPATEQHTNATATQGPAYQDSGAVTPADRVPDGQQPDAMADGDDARQQTTAGSEPGAPPAEDARPQQPGTGMTEMASPVRQPRVPSPGAGPAGSAGDTVPGELPGVTVLHGHTSPETAYLVGDYPYGRLRCEKRYWLETADKGRYRGQVRLVTQTTNPKQPGRPWNKPHLEQYRAWSVMYLNQDGHVKVRSISDWGPSGSDDARMRLDGTYGQLVGEERAAYDMLVERGRRGRNWDSWYDALGFIHGYQAEHGALPDAGQVQAAPGFYADDATSRMAIAVAAAGLGGVHAGPGAPASPVAGTPAAAPPARDGEPADGTRPQSPAVPEDPGDGEPAPGQGVSREGADFRYELAYAFALGSNPPGSFEDERARDYAAWYVARHGGEEPAGEIPAHSFEWRRFAELGYPARAPVAEQAEAGTAAPADEPVAADAPPAGPAGGTGTEESAHAPAAAPPEPDTADLDADGPGQPGAAGQTAPAAAAEPETASPRTGEAADVPGTAGPAGPDQAGRYGARIRVSLESGPPVVSGTDFNDDPPELREALRANGFEWRKRLQVWEYTGRRRGPGPLDAAGAIRALVARLDRESAAPAPAAREFPPTPQQQAILGAFLDGKGIAVQALAGTGKTTTLVLLARALLERSPEARIVYTAFNASIVKDARRGRFGRNVTASTMHSLARQALLQTGYAGKIEHADKGARWPEQWAEVLGIPEGTAAGTRDGAVPADAVEVARLVMATVRKFRESADGEPGRQHLPYLAGPGGSSLSESVLSYARQAWADISGTGNARLLAAGRALRVEHDDYLKVWALSRPRIDAQVIFFDEAQDVNDVMRAVVLDQPAQTVVVGDSHQSIYGFRGAIDALKDWPADIVLPLTQSWRFGSAAAEFGNLFLRSLGSKLLLEGNPARETRLGVAAEPDAILCRTNATAVAEVFAGLESGKRTALAGGGDAIKEIAKAARDLQAGKGTRHPDLSRFADWDEVRHYAQHDEDGKSLQVFVRLIDRHGPGGLIDMIGRLTPEGDTRNPPQLTISTAHKAKGLEWDVVRVAGDFRGPVTDPETGEVTWPAPEERRLAYVAATRARKLLEPGSLSWIYNYPLPGARLTQGPAQGKDREAQAAAPDAPRIEPDATVQTGRAQVPAAQDSQEAAQARPGHSRTADAPEQQHRAPAPAAAEAAAGADGQATGAGEPPTGQQGLAEGKEDEPEPGSPADAAAVSQQAAGADNSSSPQGEADAVTRLRALAGQHGLTVTADQLSPTNALITITDGGRTVLLHDDISGTAAGGLRIDPGEEDAYLAARRDYPGLPARALLDWVRRSPDAPAQLSLSDARAIAEDCGLTAQPVRAAGQSFIVFRELGFDRAVLAFEPASPAASSGLVTVPVPAIGAYLRAHREAIPPRWAAVLGKRDDWASQLTALAPYLIDGTSLRSPQARRHVAAAADAAALDDHRTVKEELRRAWTAAGPFAPAPDREADLVRIIGDVVPRYQQITGDGARYAAEIAHASGPEWDWIAQWTRDHPEILTAAPPSPAAVSQRDADERAQAAAEGETLAQAAKAAFDAGDYPAALALIDQGETANPDRAGLWEAARDTILEKAAATGHASQETTAGQAAPPAAEAEAPQPHLPAATASGAASNGAGASPGTAGTRHPVAGDPPSTAGLPAPAAATADGQRDQDQPAPGADATVASPLGGQPSSPGPQPQPEPLPAAAAYSDPRQVRADYHAALRDYSALCDTEAGRTLVWTLPPSVLRPASNRPDAIALDAAWRAVRHASWRPAFAGDAQEVAGRFTAWAQAASAMARNLAAEKHRARKFRQALDTFTGSATRLASRTQATARDSAAWAGVFAGIPASIQPAGPDHGETAAPDDAQPDAATATTPTRPAPADGKGTYPGHDEAAGNGPAEPGAAPLTNSDLAAELRRLPGFARWLSDASAPPAGDQNSQRPGAGSSAVCDERGIEITVSGPGFTRHGLVTWPQAASWIDNGATPARLGLAVIADRLSTFCRDHRSQLIAAGSSDPDAAAAELAQIRDTAVARIVDAALRSRGAAVPVPPAAPDDPAWYTTVLITRPDRTAGKAENAALERLTRLRTAIREPQPATAAEIKATIRRWTRYGGLPDLVRALDNPAAMRAWISEQASRRGEGQHDSAGERWYGSSPDGLITDRNGDDRAPVLIRWEEIPAWVQPGITSSQRDRLLTAADATTAIARRWLTAAVHPNAGLTAPAEEEDEQARGRLTEAVDAVWAAIEAAPPPSPADLETARHVYRDTGPVQPALFDNPQLGSTPAQDTARATASRQQRPAAPRPAVPPGAGRLAAITGTPPAKDAPRQDPSARPGTGTRHTPSAGLAGQRQPGADRPEEDNAAKDQAARPADPARASGAPEHNPAPAEVPAPAGAALADDPEAPQTPATNSDLAIALHSMSDQQLTSFLALEKTPDGHGSLTDRRKGLPDAGASQMLNFDHGGVRITVSSRQSRRHGQISWRQVASWIDTGLTPARLGIIIGASQLGTFTNARRDELVAAGKGNIDAAIRELRQISNDAIDAALGAAIGTRDADAPVPPASRRKPAYRTMAMLTGPDPSATPEENTALARIAELGAAIRGIQPVTPADIRAAVRWWIGDGLPEYARALASPEAMRAWIRSQASGPASRPGQATYDGGRYYSAYPEGLRTSQGSDTRLTPWILWEEIPAWIQPGLSPSARDRLAAAAPGPAPVRTRTAAAIPLPGAGGQAGQADDPLPGPLREAVDAAWAAIEAAPPPSPAALDHARTSYRATGTAQQARPGSPATIGQPGRAETPAPRPGAEPRPALPLPAAAPAAHRQDELPAAAAVGTSAGTGTWSRRELAALPQPAVTPDPLTDDDIFLGISRLPTLVISDLFRAVDTGQPLGSVGRLTPSYSGERAPGEPDQGAREDVTAEPAGLRIQVDPAGSRRTGLVTWRQVDDLLRPGNALGRRQIVTQAWQVRVGFMAANSSFRAVGEGRLAAAAEDELRAHAAAAVTAILAAAHPSAGGPAPQTADENATAERIADLAAALPSGPPRSRTPAGQVASGDIIRHPGYRYQPFRVAAPPRQSDAAVEITGRLTEPTGTEPAGPITLTLPRAGRPGPVVSVIPFPARSLRPLFPGQDTAADTGWPADARPDRADRAPAGIPSDAVPAPDAGTPAPDAPRDRSQEQQPLRPLFPEPPAEDGADEIQAVAPENDPAAPGPQPGDRQLPPAPPRQPTEATETGDPPGASAEATEPDTPAEAATANPSPVPDAVSPTEENTMPSDPPAPTLPPPPIAETASQARDGAAAAPAAAPSASEPAGRASSRTVPSQARPAAPTGDGTDLLGELDRVLDAIIERRRGTSGQDGGPRDDFTDIRTAFTFLRSALDIGGPPGLVTAGYGAYPAFAAAPAPPRAAPGPAPSAAPGTGEFDDIRSAFADLRRVLGLPPAGRHAPGSAPSPDPSASRLLDRAAEEAQACARWYRDTPEWRRISTIGRAARELVTAIRDAAKDYWAEIRQDIRVRGFARTLAARVSLAVSGTAHLLAGRLEHAGRGDTRMWRAAWGLHRATATYADGIMRYALPGRPDRMTDDRRIIGDLDARRRPAHGGAGTEQAQNPVRLARTSFTAPSPRPAAAVPADEPVHHPATLASPRRATGHRA